MSALTWRQRLARWLDPGHYIVAARKAAIVDRLFQLQEAAIMRPETVHPEVRQAVMELLEAREVEAPSEQRRRGPPPNEFTSETAPRPGGRRRSPQGR